MLRAAAHTYNSQHHCTGVLSCLHLQITGGRNGYGAKLANIFSTEFIIETCDGQRQRRYRQVGQGRVSGFGSGDGRMVQGPVKLRSCRIQGCSFRAPCHAPLPVSCTDNLPASAAQVFRNNMSIKEEPKITSCKPGDNWTCVTFKPDLAKFGMEVLEEDTVMLMRKRVYDLAGILGKTCKVGHGRGLGCRCPGNVISQGSLPCLQITAELLLSTNPMVSTTAAGVPERRAPEHQVLPGICGSVPGPQGGRCPPYL